MQELKTAVEELMSARKASEANYQELKSRLAAALNPAEAMQRAAEEYKVRTKEKPKKKGGKAAAPGESGSVGGSPVGVRARLPPAPAQ